jgi:diguanylate cyclase (GGDEF)-like protein
VAEVLRSQCRDTDTPARFGGDEFAIVLPETSLEAACQVAQRISQRVTVDAEAPNLSISIGAAECPHNGATIEHILSAADHVLYNEKRRSGLSTPPDSAPRKPPTLSASSNYL